jgi:hypothetical protein
MSLPANAVMIEQPTTFIVSPGVYLLQPVMHVLPNPNRSWWQLWKPAYITYTRYVKVAINTRYANLNVGDILLIDQ